MACKEDIIDYCAEPDVSSLILRGRDGGCSGSYNCRLWGRLDFLLSVDTEQRLYWLLTGHSKECCSRLLAYVGACRPSVAQPHASN
jgi:hypothetical protein